MRHRVVACLGPFLAVFLLTTGVGAAPAAEGFRVVATIPVGSNPRGVGIDPRTDQIYVANTFSNTVSVIDGATNAVSATVPAELNPTGVDVNPRTNVVYVAHTGAGSVSVIDGVSKTVTATISVGAFP